jgi:hypothetical protein
MTRYAPLWKALEGLGYPFGPLVQLLFLTAARRQEVAAARWEEFEGDTWVISKERYKTKLAVAIPLSALARSIIDSLPRLGPYLFTTTGDTPVSGFSKAKRQLDLTSGVAGWRLHDIRRTCRTLMVKLGVRPDIAERVLGHAISRIAAVYDRYDYLAEKREALERLADEVASITSLPTDNVVVLELRRQRLTTAAKTGCPSLFPSARLSLGHQIICILRCGRSWLPLRECCCHCRRMMDRFATLLRRQPSVHYAKYLHLRPADGLHTS